MRQKKGKLWKQICCGLLLLMAGLTGCVGTPSMKRAVQVAELTETPVSNAQPNPYTELSVPTYVTKLEDTYFIVDCYHNQVLYNDNLEDALSGWKVMTSDMKMGHTIVGDGAVYLVDDTENNRILVFEKQDGTFFQTQTLDGIGVRPHFLVYDEPTETFYAWSSMTGEMYLIHRNEADNRMYVSDIKRIEQLNGVYVRSFTIEGENIYFVSGTSSILRADLNTFAVREEYPVPPELAGMIQLTKIEDAYYITVSTDASGNQDAATIVRADRLENLAAGEYEDIYHYFVGGGTPYYITYFDDAYYLTEHRVAGHSIWRFQVKDQEIVNVEAVY